MNSVARARAISQGVGFERSPLTPITLEGAVVETVIVTCVEKVADDGLKVHVERDGSPLQVNVIAPADWLATFKKKEKFAGCPGLTAALS